MMTDALLKAYLKADQFLVDAANFSVKKLNWTTGWTRAEIADVVHISGWSIGNVLLYNGTTASSLVGGMSLLAIAAAHGLYNMKDKNDERTKNGQALFFNPDLMNTRFRQISNIGVGVSMPLMSNEISRPTGLGYMGFGLATYVMRADYQAPRKNCVKRGLDHLAEFARNYRARTQPQPVPITANMGELK